jgi:UDP-GlcNAc:undecaprenyl-phosphate GlcNAc-1-phosphate transferase
MFYLLIFLSSLVLTAILSLAVKKIAVYFKIVDRPGANQAGADLKTNRKIHAWPTPLLGGSAIFISYFFLLFLFAGHFLSGNLRLFHLLGFFSGALIIMIGGILDDKYDLKPNIQIIFPLLAVVAVIGGGVEITKITNPFGGYLNLSSLVFISPFLIALWLMGMMYTTKLLDGVDGLVTGVSAIGGFIIFLFTITTRYYQPDIAFAAILLAGSCAGFLIFNWHPAKIFLGEGGSLLLGYILGVLAIISGGKIAIALLVMGIPILDVAWTILRRLLKGKNPFKFSDRQHLHHRLLALGLSQRQTVLIFYLLSAAFGLSGLFLQSRGKFWALIILATLMLLLVIVFWGLDYIRSQKRRPKLLLHICCAPCGTYISRDRLASRYELTWYFYNSNLVSFEEYEKRLAAARFVAEKLAFPLIIEPYDHTAWQALTAGRANDPERGERCRICYRDRLEKTAQLARVQGFDFFSSSLLVSPYKDTEAIREISRAAAKINNVAFLEEDFQVDDGYRRSQELAKDLGIYRQKFCGCEYSCLR